MSGANTVVYYCAEKYCLNTVNSPDKTCWKCSMMMAPMTQITKVKKLLYECRRTLCHNIVPNDNEDCEPCAKANKICKMAPSPLPTKYTTQPVTVVFQCADNNCGNHVKTKGLYCITCTAEYLGNINNTTEDISNNKLTVLPKPDHYMFSYGEIEYVVNSGGGIPAFGIGDQYYYFDTGLQVTEDVILQAIAKYFRELMEEEVHAPARKKEWFNKGADF